MSKAKLSLNYDTFLGCNFLCIEFNNIIYRFRISDYVVKIARLKKAPKDYIVVYVYGDGSVEEEYLELDYMFGKVGLPKSLRNQIKGVVLA